MTKQHRAKLDKRNAARREKRAAKNKTIKLSSVWEHPLGDCAYSTDDNTLIYLRDILRSTNLRQSDVDMLRKELKSRIREPDSVMDEVSRNRAKEDREPNVALEFLKFRDGERWTPEELKQMNDKAFRDIMLEGSSVLPSPRKPDLLVEAHQIVTDRHAKYGHPKEDFTRIAGMWSSYLGYPITASDVACMMIQLKLSRSKANYGRDNMVDVVGYAICHEDLQE